MKTIYWLSTGLLSGYLMLSSYTYLFSKSTIEGIRELGFPDFFRVELAILKLIAAILLVLPYTPMQIKEWTYAGVGLFILTAIIAHAAHKDPFNINLINIFLLGLLVVSNVYLKKMLG